jgi:hypothetical protein
MEADTAIAMGRNAEGKRNQFFCFLVQRAAAQSGISERRKPVQGIRDVFAQLFDITEMRFVIAGKSFVMVSGAFSC